MKQTFTFHSSTLPHHTGKIPANAPDLSIEAFENGQYGEALCALLDSIDKNLRNRDTPDSENKFTIHHGPITIQIKWDQENIYIHAPFLLLPDKNPLALLRQVTQLNFSDLDLARLCLRDNQLHFEYNCPLAFSHPRKIYQTLEEICLVGKHYDYEFQKQFQARRILSPCFTPYSTEEINYIYDAIQESCRECLDQLRYFEPSRKFYEMHHILAITLMKIIYIAHPQGKLYHTLTQAIRDLDKDLPMSMIIAGARQSIKELLDTPIEEIAKSLYHIETFIPEKQYIYSSDIRENIKPVTNRHLHNMKPENTENYAYRSRTNFMKATTNTTCRKKPTACCKQLCGKFPDNLGTWQPPFFSKRWKHSCKTQENDTPRPYPCSITP